MRSRLRVRRQKIPNCAPEDAYHSTTVCFEGQDVDVALRPQLGVPGIALGNSAWRTALIIRCMYAETSLDRVCRHKVASPYLSRLVFKDRSHS